VEGNGVSVAAMCAESSPPNIAYLLSRTGGWTQTIEIKKEIERDRALDVAVRIT